MGFGLCLLAPARMCWQACRAGCAQMRKVHELASTLAWPCRAALTAGMKTSRRLCCQVTDKVVANACLRVFRCAPNAVAQQRIHCCSTKCIAGGLGSSVSVCLAAVVVVCVMSPRNVAGLPEDKHAGDEPDLCHMPCLQC
ncbi:hypothetical protein COO60DRAFT_110730 [Scenedesmus sp. NREL 46B-D3]|nr:hypothetical protein COO60DRAFT_110730 [Scenedesmus sp. NREL 46B-D3]